MGKIESAVLHPNWFLASIVVNKKKLSSSAAVTLNNRFAELVTEMTRHFHDSLYINV